MGQVRPDTRAGRVEKALIDAGVAYERVPGPQRRRPSARSLTEGTGESSYPAVQFEDGTWYREQSKDMAQTIRDGKLMEKDSGGTPAEASLH